MISVVIPTLNADKILAATIAAMTGPIMSELIIVDGGSGDGTARVADQAGARIILSERGRGTQLAAGARAAEGEWLLFLHADTVLSEGWDREVGAFVAHAANKSKAGVFRFSLDDRCWQARMLEKLVALRCWLFALPYGDQGLLIHRTLYDAIGGYKAIPLMEDVDIIRRVGRSRLHFFQIPAITSAERYRQSGYLRRMFGNLGCLALYFLGVSPDRISRIYSR